jgi:hypothetical protein
MSTTAKVYLRNFADYMKAKTSKRVKVNLANGTASWAGATMTLRENESGELVSTIEQIVPKCD